MTATIPKSIVQECKSKLVQKRAEILNRLRQSLQEMKDLRFSTGDEADQSASLLAENDILSTQRRWQEQLLEIEFALSRIDDGSYGICEETENPIEPDRLLALPWTRLSIEGAEVREAMQRRYARH